MFIPVFSMLGSIMFTDYSVEVLGYSIVSIKIFIGIVLDTLILYDQWFPHVECI